MNLDNHIADVFVQYLRELSQSLRIASLAPLQIMHGALREGTGARELTVTLSCTSLGHAYHAGSHPFELHPH